MVQDKEIVDLLDRVIQSCRDQQGQINDLITICNKQQDQIDRLVQYMKEAKRQYFLES